jgi:thiamine-monophosphate kinase
MPESRGEFARIAALVAGLPRGEGVIVGPGDDAAVLRVRDGHDLVATTDAFVEGRHFRRDLLSPAEVGVRLAAANLSDLAAMAALPRWALLSLVVPSAWSAEAVRELEHACARSLAAEGAAVVGGNLVSGEGPLCATLTLLGEIERERAWMRSGARVGDVLAVTGVPGSAAAALALALSDSPPSWSRVPAALGELFRAPSSRVQLARALARSGGVRAAIDLSDGLAGDLAHLCAASGVGARVDEASLPASESLRSAVRTLLTIPAPLGRSRPTDAVALRTHLCLSASDDYELLLAIDPQTWTRCATVAAAAGTPLAAIGEITPGPGLSLRTAAGAEGPLPGSGWDHFSGPA